MPTKKSSSAVIDDYIAGFPRDVQEILEKTRKTIRRAAPDADEAIKNQIPTFVLNGNLVHFAAFKNHIGLYPSPTGMIEFQDELSAYKAVRGSVRFPLSEPMPFDLIRRLVEYRVAETRTRAKHKGADDGKKRTRHD
jgi:uncharacterized protein YdhG (YjbR/CyaY superfamily)